MGLPAPHARKKLHTRSIVMEGYERDDGLFDIEAHIVDTKSIEFRHMKRGNLPPGTPIHDMELRLTVDADKVVRDIAVFSHVAPYAACLTVGPGFRELIGASLTSGWRQAVNEKLGGNKSCTHLKELLGPIATVAMQTISGGHRALREARVDTTATPKRPFFLNRCKAWAEDGENVKEMLPAFYVPPSPKP